MKKIFCFFCVLMISSCVRLSESSPLSFGLWGRTYSMTPAKYGEILARTEEVTEEEYEEGKSIAVLDGQPIYYFKKYVVTHTERPVWMATSDGILKGMVAPIFIKGDKEYDVVARTVIDGVEYNVINPYKNELIFVDKDGNIYKHVGHKVGENKFTLTENKFSTYPKNLKIRQIVSRTTKTDDPFMGMEIIYDGKHGEHYVMKYRDFDGSGHEQYKTVNFTEDYEIIDFDNLKVRVLSATPHSFEGIVIK